MSRRSITFLTIAVLSVWSVQGQADEKSAGPPPVQTGSVTGTVVDLKGRPVVGAEVWGLYRMEKFGPTRSGDDGRFRLPAIAVDKPITLWADVPGLAREHRAEIRIFPGKDHDIGRLTLLPGTRISGRAVDAQGKPIAGTKVKLDVYRHVLGHTIDSQGTEWTFNTDDGGHFTTPPLPAGKASFYLTAAGKVRTFVQKNAEPGTPTIDLGAITLPDEVPVKGVVVDNEGKPAPGVDILPNYDWQCATKTDKEGRFTLHGVGKNLKTLLVQSNDYFAPEPFNVSPGQTDLKLTVIKAYEIHGTAVDAETGKPVPLDTVRLCIVERDPDDGHITLAG
jgi:hypothetical protein